MTTSLLTNLIRRLSGSAYCFFWFFSIFSGFFVLICPALPLALLLPKIYRKWSDIVFGMWEPYPVAMMEIFLHVRVTMSGDLIDPSEGAIVIMNHRTRLDWNFLWAAFFHSGHPHCHSLKFILKAPIMHIPGPGWVMQACSFLFIHRNWEKDQQLLTNSLTYLRNTDRNFQILIFPEGTDLTPKSLERSHHYADKNGLNRYYRVLHPKTTGFVYLVNRMRTNEQLQAVYDLTVGYPKVIAETEFDLLRGKFPSQIHFNIERHDASEIPKSEHDLKNWLSSKWKDKEHKLHRFYSSGSFTNQDFTPDCLEQNNTNEFLKKRAQAESSMYEDCKCGTLYSNSAFSKHILNNDMFVVNNQNIPDETNETKQKNGGILNKKICEKNQNSTPGNTLYLCLIFWTTLVLSFFYFLITNFYFQIWVGFYFILFLSLSFVSQGFHQLLARYNRIHLVNQVFKKCD